MNQWSGKKVLFLGDSITDKIHVGTTKNYWQYLEEFLGLQAFVYGINGAQWNAIIPQTEAFLKEHSKEEADAVSVFMGTNDFNSAVPPGEWWNIREEVVNSKGEMIKLPRRIFSEDMNTYRGRINVGLRYLKTTFPSAQIFLCTMIHRGFAEFSETNVQPEESFANRCGLFVDQYVEDLRRAGSIWSVPVIDLYEKSGLFPMNDAHAPYFHDAGFDRLHPAASGHERIARTMMYQMLALPSSFH